MHTVSANGATIPAIGLGTWTLKGEACSELVAQALRSGYRHVDTAIMYGNEADVGRGLKSGGVARNDVFLTTKVWYTDIGAGDLERAAEGSLKRLGVDAVDLLLIHWPNPDIPLAESIGALNRAREKGLTRHIGVSNFTLAMIEEATRISEAPLVCNQVESHPFLDQRRILAACRAHGMAMTAYAPIGRAGDLLKAGPIVAAAAAHRKTPAQIVLRWHVQQKGVVCIPRTSRIERLKENAAIFDFELTRSEMEAIGGLRSANRRICDYAFSPAWDAA